MPDRPQAPFRCPAGSYSAAFLHIMKQRTKEKKEVGVVPDDVLRMTAENFEETAVQSPVPVLVEFGAPWCVDCRRLDAAVNALAVRYRGIVRFGRVDVEQEPKLAVLLGAGGLPSVLLMERGRIYAHVGGALPLAHYERLLDRLLSGKPVSAG